MKRDFFGHAIPANRRFKLRCLWCNAEFKAARSDARTNTPKCRTALSRYVRKHGSPPLFPFGVQPDPKPKPPKPAGKGSKGQK